MAIFNCKMCGGSLAIQPGESVAICEYCGSKQTLPKLNDERRANLYDRANYFRRSGEYDKAAGVFETILNEDKEDAEAYWSLVLCRYGIEYVEDPKTKKRVATVNRVQYTPVQLDEDYRNAIKYANTIQREIFEEEAKYIDEIQKEFLKISEKEEPFDIFISYKESDDRGNRTQDSVYAYDLYEKLTNEGYKVFFSRVTLESKLGSEYEPYIFAALNSAKVMLLLGTRKEYFNAVWVKNEWSRYLSFIKAGEKKVLIPIYRDMSPYDLPEELAYLQAQDMSKIGFEQDLIRGIKKIVSPDIHVKEKEASTTNIIVKTMLERAKDSLAKRDWEKAKTYFDNVLDYDPNNVDAYLGKLLAAYNSASLEELAESKTSIKTNENYAKLLQINNRDLIESLDNCERIIQERIAEEKTKVKENSQKVAKLALKACIAVGVAFGIFLLVTKVILPSRQYNKAMVLYEAGKYEEALSYLDENKPYKDSLDILKECEYNIAKQELESGSGNKAKVWFRDLGDYKDSKQLLEEAIKKEAYQKGKELFEAKEYSQAIVEFSKAEGYSDGEEQLLECKYQIWLSQKESVDVMSYSSVGLWGYIEELQAAGYKDSVEMALECKYQFCVKTQNNPSSWTRDYIEELVAVGYKDSATIAKNIYRWHAEVTVERSTQMGSYQSAKISAKLSGGKPNEKTTVRFEIALSNGEKSSYDNEGKQYNTGNTVTATFYNDNGNEDLFSYTIKVNVYDKNNNLIGSYDGEIIKPDWWD